MSEPKESVALWEAIEVVRSHTQDGQVHTFRLAHGILLGANWQVAQVIAAMRDAPRVEITEPNAQSLGHGLAIVDENGYLFIETHRAGHAIEFASRTPIPEGGIAIVSGGDE